MRKTLPHQPIPHPITDQGSHRQENVRRSRYRIPGLWFVYFKRTFAAKLCDSIWAIGGSRRRSDSLVECSVRIIAIGQFYSINRGVRKAASDKARLNQHDVNTKSFYFESQRISLKASTAYLLCMVCALARKGQSSAHMNRGIAYAEQHKPAKAVADLGAAIDASKTNAAAYYNRGNVL